MMRHLGRQNVLGVFGLCKACMHVSHFVLCSSPALVVGVLIMGKHGIIVVMIRDGNGTDISDRSKDHR